MIKICEQCSKEFIPTQHGNKYKDIQRFCSQRCREVYYYQNPKWDKQICKHCGKEFTPKARDRVTHCSRECAYEYRRRNSKIRIIKHKQIDKIHCINCGSVFDRKSKRSKYCSEKCRHGFNKEEELKKLREKYQSNLVYINKICVECGKEFKTSDNGNKYCSFKCQQCSVKRNGRHKRRLRIESNGYEVISLQNIIKKCGYICGVCGKSIDKEIPSANRYGLTIDHIIPIAKGGAHIESNTQLAHMICNSYKGDKLNYYL